MEIKFNVTGTNIKALVKAISDILGEPSKYLGAPSFSYQIGDAFKVKRDGTLCIADTVTSNVGDPLFYELYERGFIAQEDEGIKEPKRVERLLFCGEFGEQIKDYLNCIFSAKEKLIKQALNVDTLKINIYENSIGFPWFKEETSEEDMRTCMRFLSSLVKTAIDHCLIMQDENSVKNKKYAFLCFLKCIGLTGDEYEKTREALLRNFD